MDPHLNYEWGKFLLVDGSFINGVRDGEVDHFTAGKEEGKQTPRRESTALERTGNRPPLRGGFSCPHLHATMGIAPEQETHHKTIPSPTALKRSSVFGFMGMTCLQSWSFSKALLTQFTKAYFSSSGVERGPEINTQGTPVGKPTNAAAQSPPPGTWGEGVGWDGVQQFAKARE